MLCAFWQCVRVRSACSGGGKYFGTVDVNPRIRVWYLGLVCGPPFPRGPVPGFLPPFILTWRY